MPLSLSGRLTTPFGDPLPNATIRFDAVRTSGAVLSYTNAEASTDSGGDYAISVEYGTYDIRVKTSQSFYTLATSVQINSDNTEPDLNALLVAHTGYEILTPQIILDFQALRDEAIGAAQSASSDAEQTGLDRVATGEDRQQTGLDRVATGEDAAATAADRIATGEDRQAVAADREQTGLDRVATGEDRQQTGEDRVATGEDADATAADRVATGEDRTASGESALEAKHWANYPIDSPVPEGDGTELSARHWADISRQRAVNAMVAQGAWDASTGTLPPEPAGASYWLVTGAANGVTINSVEYRNKDMLLWTPDDAGGGSWSKIDNTDSVTSVANKTGAVELTPADAGADPAGTATTKVAEHEAKSSAHTPAQVGADPSGAAQSAQDHAVQRSNHTGTQLLNTISDAGSAAAKNTGTGAGEVPTTAEADGRYAQLAAANDFSQMPTINGDPIVESGSNSDGHWTRWASGYGMSSSTANYNQNGGLNVVLPMLFEPGQWNAQITPRSQLSGVANGSYVAEGGPRDATAQATVQFKVLQHTSTDVSYITSSMSVNIFAHGQSLNI